MSQYTKEGTYGFPIFGSSNVHLQSRTGAADMRILSEAASRYYMFMSANNKDSGKTALMRSLAISLCGRLCDKYPFLTCWLKCFDKKTLEIVCTTIMRLILEYGNVIWDNCTQHEKQEQNRTTDDWTWIIQLSLTLRMLGTIFRRLHFEIVSPPPPPPTHTHTHSPPKKIRFEISCKLSLSHWDDLVSKPFKRQSPLQQTIFIHVLYVVFFFCFFHICI